MPTMQERFDTFQNALRVWDTYWDSFPLDKDPPEKSKKFRTLEGRLEAARVAMEEAPVTSIADFKIKLAWMLEQHRCVGDGFDDEEKGILFRHLDALARRLGEVPHD